MNDAELSLEEKSKLYRLAALVRETSTLFGIYLLMTLVIFVGQVFTTPFPSHSSIVLILLCLGAWVVLWALLLLRIHRLSQVLGMSSFLCTGAGFVGLVVFPLFWIVVFSLIVMGRKRLAANQITMNRYGPSKEDINSLRPTLNDERLI